MLTIGIRLAWQEDLYHRFHCPQANLFMLTSFAGYARVEYGTIRFHCPQANLFMLTDANVDALRIPA